MTDVSRGSARADDSRSRCTAALLGNEVHVWCVRLEYERELVQKAHALLTEDERDRSEQFRFPELRNEFVVSRGLLRLLLSRLGCGPPSDLTFTYGPHGKPALEGDLGRSLAFNVSHSRGILACAFALDRDVGIDIEFHRSLADYEAIARRFFSPAEHRELMSTVESARIVAFYDCWVRKEAFVKARGGGLSIPLDSFRVSLLPGRAAALLAVRDSPGEERGWTIRAFSPAPGFSGAVAVRDPQKRVRIQGADTRGIIAVSGFL